MTPDEFKQARKTIGLTQTSMAKRLGQSTSMIQSMESGRRHIGLTVDLAVKYLLDQVK